MTPKIDLFFTAAPKSSWLPLEELRFPSVSASVKDFWMQILIQHMFSCTPNTAEARPKSGFDLTGARVQVWEGWLTVSHA